MNELNLDNPAAHAVPASDENARRKYTTDAEILLKLLREAREHDEPVYEELIREYGFEDPKQTFRELRGQGFKIRNRVEWLDDEVDLSYGLVFDLAMDSRW